MNTNNNLTLHLKALLKKSWKKTVLFLIIAIIVTVLSMIMPMLIKYILDTAITGGNVTLLIKVGLIYLILTLLVSFLELCLNVLRSNIHKSYFAVFKVKLLNHLSKFDGNFFSNKHTGDLFKTLESDLYTVENFGVDTYIQVIVAGIEALFSFCILWKMNFQLLIYVLIIQIIIIIIQKLINVQSSKSIQEVRMIAGKQADKHEAYLSNLMNIVITKGKQAILSDYIKGERDYARKAIFTDFILSCSQFSFSVLTNFTTVIIYLVGGYHVIKGKMTVGEMIAFGEYTVFLIGPIRNIVSMNNQIQQTKVALNRIYAILKRPTNTEQKKMEDLISDCPYKICFENVIFSYEGKRVFNDLNLELNTGIVYAFMGSSGGGKTTIVNLLYRLWEPDAGSITLNGIPISQYNLNSYRKLFSIVPQEHCLLDDTIYNNICWSKLKSRDEVEQVCRAVELWGWISSLENGIDTVIGENGVKISGGQKQRMGIARALLMPTPILVLDESTSAIDNETQEKIWRNLKPYFEGKIVMMIAHRLESIKKADYVYVIEDGIVAQKGTYQQIFK